jgi:hypothetical protein
MWGPVAVHAAEARQRGGVLDKEGGDGRVRCGGACAVSPPGASDAAKKRVLAEGAARGVCAVGQAAPFGEYSC